MAGFKKWLMGIRAGTPLQLLNAERRKQKKKKKKRPKEEHKEGNDHFRSGFMQ